MVRACFAARWCLTSWEDEFVGSLAGHRTISPKQRAVLCRLYRKTQEAAAA